MMRINLFKPQDDPNKTHKFEMDVHGNVIHSPNCWCILLAPEMNSPLFKVNVPENNDGREECFWCGKKTVKKQLLTSSYDICEDCEK